MKTYVYMHKPVAVFRAQVTMPGTITYPRDFLIYDGVTLGAAGNVGYPMTLLLGTAAGLDDLGRQRVRKNADATHIYLGRFSQGIHDGELNVQDNAYITVLEDYRVWARLPYINLATGEIYKDSDFDDANAAYPRPIANGGACF